METYKTSTIQLSQNRDWQFTDRCVSYAYGGDGDDIIHPSLFFSLSLPLYRNRADGKNQKKNYQSLDFFARVCIECFDSIALCAVKQRHR